MAKTYETEQVQEKFLLAAVDLEDGTDVSYSLDELAELTETAGGIVVGRLIQKRESVHPGTYVGKGKIEDYCPSIVDSLAIARQKYPGVRNSLDALCTRFEVDSSMRTLHGACLDARLLGEVYLAMTRSQDDLVEILNAMNRPKIVMPDNKLLLVAECPEEDLAEHKAFMERLRKKCKEHPPVWETVLGTFDNLDPALKTVAPAAEETAESATK